MIWKNIARNNLIYNDKLFNFSGDNNYAGIVSENFINNQSNNLQPSTSSSE